MTTEEYDDWEDDGPLVPVSQIAGMSEIAIYCDASPHAVWNWTKRHNFPEPIGRVSNRPIWDMRDVRVWFKNQKVSKNNWLTGQRRGPNKPKES